MYFAQTLDLALDSSEVLCLSLVSILSVKAPSSLMSSHVIIHYHSFMWVWITIKFKYKIMKDLWFVLKSH